MVVLTCLCTTECVASLLLSVENVSAKVQLALLVHPVLAGNVAKILNIPSLTSYYVQSAECASWLAGHLVGAEPANACSPILNAHETHGAIVIVDRGICSFADKASHAQQAGAKAVVVVNNISQEPAFAMGCDHAAADLHIVAAMVTQDTGQQLHVASHDSSVAIIASVQPLNQATADTAAAKHITVEHQVYVPDMTQDWLQRLYSKYEISSTHSWQTEMTELMTSVQYQLQDLSRQSFSP